MVAYPSLGLFAGIFFVTRPALPGNRVGRMTGVFVRIPHPLQLAQTKRDRTGRTRQLYNNKPVLGEKFSVGGRGLPFKPPPSPEDRPACLAKGPRPIFGSFLRSSPPEHLSLGRGDDVPKKSARAQPLPDLIVEIKKSK